MRRPGRSAIDTPGRFCKRMSLAGTAAFLCLVLPTLSASRLARVGVGVASVEFCHFHKSSTKDCERDGEVEYGLMDGAGVLD